MTGCSNGLNSGEASWRRGMVGIEAPMSSAVITACTLGSTNAARLSTAWMRPCARGLRTMTACNMPSNARSSTYCPRPVRKRKSSIRSTGLPMRALVARLRSMSDDDGRLLIAQRAGNAQGGERRSFGVRGGRFPLQRDDKSAGGAFDLDLMHVAGRMRIRHELDLLL